MLQVHTFFMCLAHKRKQYYYFFFKVIHEKTNLETCLTDQAQCVAMSSFCKNGWILCKLDELFSHRSYCALIYMVFIHLIINSWFEKK